MSRYDSDEWWDDEGRPIRPKAHCPHEHIQYCPLYIAGHDGRICHLSCVDDLAAPCLVERGEMKYDPAVALVRAADPQMIADAERGENSRVSKEQRRRNMRAAGIN